MPRRPIRASSRKERVIRGLLWASIVLGGIVGLPVVLVVGTVMIGFLPVHVAQVEFDSAAWQAADPYDPDRTRQRMMDDLLEHRLRVGMPAGEVTELLGPPTMEMHIEGRKVCEYMLGPSRIVTPFLEAEFLRLELLEDGTVGGIELIEMD